MSMPIPGSEQFSSRPVDPDELARSLPSTLDVHTVSQEQGDAHAPEQQHERECDKLRQHRRERRLGHGHPQMAHPLAANRHRPLDHLDRVRRRS